MHAFILAGGFATRLWPLTEKRAKPLLPLAGKPLLTHLVDNIPKNVPVTVSTNAAFEGNFREWSDTVDRTVELIIEGTEKDDHKLGALGAVASWVKDKNIHDDLLLLTGDNYLGFPLSRFISLFSSHPLVAAHDIGDLAKASAFGTVTLQHSSPLQPCPERVEGRRGEEPGVRAVEAFEEKPLSPKTTLVSAGCVLLPASTLPVLLEFAKKHPDNVGGILEEFLRRKIPVECMPFTEPWMDIGSFGSYLDAHRFLVGQRALIDPSASLTSTDTHGSVSIAAGCHIAESDLTDCMIFENARITDCTLRDCVIDEGCVLEGLDLSKQMLRAGTVLRRQN